MASTARPRTPERARRRGRARERGRSAEPPGKPWGGRRPRDAAEARQWLLEAALACFAEKGAAHTTLADVARAAGVSRPTVYKHFADRDAIVRALLLWAAPAFTARLAAALSSAEGLEDGLVEGIAFCLRELPGDPLFGLLFREDAALRTSRLVLSSPEILEATASLLEPVLAPARAEGRLREGVTAVDVVEWTIRFIFSYALVPSPRHEGEHALRELARALILPAIVRDARDVQDGRSIAERARTMDSGGRS